MLSMPPATTISELPVWIACWPSATAFSPEPQTLLMVMAATADGNPPPSAAWRAGFCPSPAPTTLPIMHSETLAGSMPARFTASRTAIDPNCGAVTSASDPWNFPTGVRTAETITTSSMKAMVTNPLNPEWQTDDYKMETLCLPTPHCQLTRHRPQQANEGCLHRSGTPLSSSSYCWVHRWAGRAECIRWPV